MHSFACQNANRAGRQIILSHSNQRKHIGFGEYIRFLIRFYRILLVHVAGSLCPILGWFSLTIL